LRDTHNFIKIKGVITRLVRPTNSRDQNIKENNSKLRIEDHGRICEREDLVV